MAALDSGHIHETRRTTDERPAGKNQLGNRLPAALGQRACAVSQPLAALERAAHQRMGLESLEFLKRRKIRVLIIEMDHKAERNQVVVIVIEKRAAAGAAVQRPAERVL